MKLLSLSINGTPIEHPSGLPEYSGGFDKIVQTSLALMLMASILLALIFLILGGIHWITAGGDKQKIQSARNRLTYAIIGLVVALGSFGIMSLIGKVFNVSLLSLP